MKYVASVSWGKDSLCMLIYLLEHGYPVDYVVFFDSGKEFPEIYHTRDVFLDEYGSLYDFVYVELKPDKAFDYLCFEHPVHSRDGSTHSGYGWCGGSCRWFTTQKVNAIRKFEKTIGEFAEYVGIAYDELDRVSRRKPFQLYPLYDAGITEFDALDFCYERGFDYGGLYKIFSRVSCWCCRNKNFKEIANMKKYLPAVYADLVEMEKKIGVPMKGKVDLVTRFGLPEVNC